MGCRLEPEVPRQGRFALQVGGRIGACTGAGVCAGVSQCAASGLYHRGYNKLIQVMCKLSRENPPPLPTHLRLSLSARAANPIPVAAYGACKIRQKNPLSCQQRERQTWKETITCRARLVCFLCACVCVCFFLLFLSLSLSPPSQTGCVFICHSP